MELEQYRTEWLNKCAFLSNIRSRMVKGLGFYSTCMLPSEPATVSWLLPRDTRLLGQRQKAYYPIISMASSLSYMFLLFPSAPHVHRDKVGWHTWMLRTQWFASQLRNPELKYPPIFYKGLHTNLPIFYPVAWHLHYNEQQTNLPSAPVESLSLFSRLFYINLLEKGI